MIFLYDTFHSNTCFNLIYKLALHMDVQQFSRMGYFANVDRSVPEWLSMYRSIFAIKKVE